MCGDVNLYLNDPDDRQRAEIEVRFVVAAVMQSAMQSVREQRRLTVVIYHADHGSGAEEPQEGHRSGSAALDDGVCAAISGELAIMRQVVGEADTVMLQRSTVLDKSGMHLTGDQGLCGEDWDGQRSVAEAVSETAVCRGGQERRISGDHLSIQDFRE